MAKEGIHPEYFPDAKVRGLHLHMQLMRMPFHTACYINTCRCSATVRKC